MNSQPTPEAAAALAKHRAALQTQIDELTANSKGMPLHPVMRILQSTALTRDMARPLIAWAIPRLVHRVNNPDNAFYVMFNDTPELLDLLLLTSSIHPDWFTPDEHVTVAAAARTHNHTHAHAYETAR